LSNVPWEPHHRTRSTDALSDDLLQLGILYPDGSTWSNLDARYADFESAPSAPFVMSRGGGGGGNSWSMEQWLWPLPPAGALTFIAEWPRYRIAETRAVIDATALRAAADSAVHLWT
jgi:hypothetical protein